MKTKSWYLAKVKEICNATKTYFTWKSLFMPQKSHKKAINTFANDYQERSQKNQMSSAVRSEVTLRGQSFEKVSSCISI